MISKEFKPLIKGWRHYRVTACYNTNEDSCCYTFGIATKAPVDAVMSALKASLKDSYNLVVEPLGDGKAFYEWESLDSGCAILSRLRFVEYTTKDVEKIVIVKETIRKEL